MPRAPVVGRFAPSPSGALHFGSLVSALGSWLSARSQGGRWLLRVEDIDPPREVPGSAQSMLRELHRLGLRADGAVQYQSRSRPAHEAARDVLLQRGLAFHCACTRTELPAGGVYPGTCREGLPPGRSARSVRLRVDDRPVGFVDRVHGPQRSRLDLDCGDFVIWRADGQPAYQLAVVVDDAHQGVTEVVRGADLLASTPRQLYLQDLLGLPRPEYMHLPLALDGAGRKLSKRLAADPLDTTDPAGSLRAALSFLGQPLPASGNVDELLAQALANWRPAAVPRGTVPPGTAADDG